MASWQAWVVVPEGNQVVMSGDNEPLIQDHGRAKSFYYYSVMKLPMSTLALAIGNWQQKNICVHPWKIKIYAPSLLIPRAIMMFDSYVIKCLEAATLLLGPYPFCKLDIVVLPRCFAALGLANPNVIFISQSLLAEDGSMKIRIAHEVVHSWFGLLIGALDWTEEWLSEGFATFLEDLVHSAAIKMETVESANLSELRAYLRFRNLCAELSNTEVDLQILRPLGDCHDATTSSVVSVKNGMNAEKSFTQVHYLKGYFMLRHLHQAVGHNLFLQFLKSYVNHFTGKLVLSKQVMDFFFQEIEKQSSDLDCSGLKRLCNQWLDNSGLPQELKHFTVQESNMLYQQVKNEFEKWSYIVKATSFKKKRKNRKLDFSTINFNQNLCSDQLVLLLEYVLELKKISHEMLLLLNSTYCLDSNCADVLHRWCELIVKHKLRAKYDMLVFFLKEHQAMGVYLYGEAMISEDQRLQQLVINTYNELKNEMDYSAKLVVSEMLGDM